MDRAAQWFERPPLLASGGYRYLALGDSYTFGDAIAPSGRWPTQLVARLRELGIAIDAPHYVAGTALTAGELAERLEQARPNGPFDLVSLQVGVNNQYRHLDPETYRSEFRGLLGQALALACSERQRIFVLSIPDWGVTRFGAASGRAHVSEEIDRFNGVNRDESQAAGVGYVDVTPLTREFGDHPRALAEDGLHPSAYMYAAWVDLLLRCLWPSLGAHERAVQGA